MERSIIKIKSNAVLKEPKVILRKGEEYEAVTTYRFEVE